MRQSGNTWLRDPAARLCCVLLISPGPPGPVWEGCIVAHARQKWSLGAWAAQSVKRLTSAQVTISRFVGSSPASGSVLTAQSLEPAATSVCVSLSAPLSLSLSKINKYFFKNLRSGSELGNTG